MFFILLVTLCQLLTDYSNPESEKNKVLD
jgi:voltage-dependent calcium channel L type alpha-1D